VVHELQDRLTLYRYNGMTGSLAEERTVSLLPPGATGENYGASVVVDAKGRNLYVSNRGHDSISHYRIDGGDGVPVFSGSVPTRGRFPRHFALDPTGAFLVAANQKSDTLVVFRVDGESGALEAIGGETAVPAPVCILAAFPRQR
jgi:6-phosphogluconolactonase